MRISLGWSLVRGAPSIGELRVQRIDGSGGRFYTVVGADGSVDGQADRFLRLCSPGTSRTYAYLLVDRLRWLDAHGLTSQTASLDDLCRYMAAVGAEYPGPIGRPWRIGRPPYGQSALDTTAACLKGFYIRVGASGVNTGLAAQLAQTRLPSRADRRRKLLGHLVRTMPANPLRTTRVVRRRHPKMLPEGAAPLLREQASSARDRMIMIWLEHGGFRVGELCGLHLVDLHLRSGALCAECRVPHVHICHREPNPNGARVKTKAGWQVRDGVICGGTLRRVSPAMVHTYFDYVTGEYACAGEHGMLLVQLHGPRRGEPLAPAAVRVMLRRAGERADLGRIRPHAFRHSFAAAVLDASGGNTLVTRDAGGWSSAVTVDEVYGHADIHSEVFSAALNTVWDNQ